MSKTHEELCVEMAEECERLAGLMRNPNPGLATWNAACAEVGRRLFDMLLREFEEKKR